jgi:hypothetical protein
MENAGKKMDGPQDGLNEWRIEEPNSSCISNQERLAEGQRSQRLEFQWKPYGPSHRP